MQRQEERNRERIEQIVSINRNEIDNRIADEMESMNTN